MMLRLKPQQLADERRRGRIKASEVVGRRKRYLKEDLLEYFHSRRVKPTPENPRYQRFRGVGERRGD